MGGNASPFIADLNLSCCEYCYMTEIVKTESALAKLLSHYDDVRMGAIASQITSLTIVYSTIYSDAD